MKIVVQGIIRIPFSIAIEAESVDEALAIAESEVFIDEVRSINSEDGALIVLTGDFPSILHMSDTEVSLYTDEE